jgi:hypothetical protein
MEWTPAMADKPTARNHEIVCPCCSTKLTVAADTGDILHEERPKKGTVSWEHALQANQSKQAEAEALFAKGMDRERRADEILEKKFKEALKRADKSDTPPPRIFDLD